MLRSGSYLIKIYLSVICASICLYSYYYNYVYMRHQNIKKEKIKLNKNYFASNYKFVINNNLAQYSSYIITKGENDKINYKIEVLFLKSFKYNMTVLLKDYKCILKYKINKFEETIELNAERIFKFNSNGMNKLSFKLNMELFKAYLEKPKDFDINRLICAVILKNDYKITNQIPKLNYRNKKRSHLPLILPYFLIKFQLIYHK